ncbi:MAG: AraC family transcriptional regulator [Planctomycetes bacterium]|nr:AraC family transcriptional regulator [Planctomycetota bacterium]
MTKGFMKGWHNQSEEAEKRAGLWVNSCGHYATTSHVCPWRSRDDSLVIYCVAGKGIYKTGGREIVITEGQLFTAFPGVWHSYWSDADMGWEIWFSHYGGDNSVNLTSMCGLSIDEPVMEIGVNNEVVKRFAGLCSIVKKKELYYGLDASAQMYGLLLDLKKYSHRSDDNAPGILEAIKGEHDDVDGMARAAGMSKFHFIREFKRITGTTPWRYILNRKITSAKELLGDSDFSIKQIAYRLGFEDSNYFSRLFRKETGFSAREFRNLEQQHAK